MKKVKLIALALVAAIALMGAGYAIWSDQVFLTSTVKTGNFNIEITEVSVRTGHRQEANEVHHWHQFDWTNKGAGPTIVDGNSAIVELVDLYPGGTVQIDLKMENKGTIPAKLKSIKVECLENQELFKLLRAQTTWKANITGTKKNGELEKEAWAHVENAPYGPWRGLQDALNKLVESTNTYNNGVGLIIEPGGWFALGDDTEAGCISIKLDPSAGNEFQNNTCKFKITFNWEQWTSDPNSKPYHDYGGDGDI